MKLVRPQGQRCTFRVDCDQACQASLVIDIFPGMSQIFPLQKVDEGVWETELRLAPGEYRFCYHLYDGRVLQYVTPAGMMIDGLKAVLHVKAVPEAAVEDVMPSASDPLDQHHRLSRLAHDHYPDDPWRGTLRRIAG